MDRHAQAHDFLARLEANPHDLTAIYQLEALYASTGEWGQLTDLLTERAESLGQSEVSARLLLEAGRIADMRERNVDRGGVLLDRSLSISNGTGVEAESRIFLLAHHQEYEQLLDYFNDVVSSSDASSASRLYQRVGLIYEDAEAVEDADAAYASALQLDANNLVARWCRQRIARQAQAWDQLVVLLYEETETTDDVERQLALLLEIGDVYREKVGDEEQAATFYNHVYEFDPTNARAVAGLQQLGYDVEVAAAAPEVAEAESADESLAQADSVHEVVGFAVEDDDEGDMEFGVTAEPATEALAEPSAEASEVHEISEFEEVEEEGDVAPAEESSVGELAADSIGAEESDVEESAVEESAAEVSDAEVSDAEVSDAEVSDAEEAEISEAEEPEHSEAEQFADEVEDEPPTWTTRFDALLDAANEDDLVRAARLAARHNGGADAMWRVWEIAIARDSQRELWSRTHFLVDAPEVWEQVIAATSDASFNARVALIDLGDIERGRELGGDNERIAELLTDVEAGQANWRKFQRALEQRFDALDEDAKAKMVYLRMANVAATLGDSDKEMDALRRLDRQVPGDPVVQSHLKQIYKASEKWPMYVDIIKSEVAEFTELTEDRDEKIDLLREMIHVYRDHMNHDMMVVNTYKEILEVDPENLEAINALIELYEKLNRSSELVAMLQQKAELAKSKSGQVAIWSQIAELFLEKFRNQAEAINAYEKVLEIEPFHAPAITFLKEMYEKRRAWDSLINIHKREISTFTDVDDKVAGLKEVAELATTKLRDAEIASELWLEVRELAPDDLDALSALETLYEKSKNYRALGEVLNQKAELTEDAAERMKLYQKMGPLYSDRLNDPDGAVDAWRKALALDGDDLKAQKSLERLFIDNRRFDDLEAFYGSRDDWSGLVRLLGTLSGTIKEDDIKIDLLLRSARVWSEELGDVSRAERDLARVLQVDPRNERAALLLEPIYRAADDAANLRGVYEVILEYRSEPEDRQHYLLKLGHLHEEELSEPAVAFDWFAQAFREAPGSGADRDDVERVAASSSRFPDLVGVYEEILESAEDETLRRNMRLALGRVLSHQLDQFDAALAHFQEVLDGDAENSAALSEMETIYQRTERWDDLMAIYQRRIELTDSPEDRVGILAGMALIAEKQKGDIATAIAQHQEALKLDPNYVPSLQHLHRLYADGAEYAELADVIRREIDIVERAALDRLDDTTAVVDPHSLLPGYSEAEELGDAISSEASDLSEASELSDASGERSEVSEAHEVEAELAAQGRALYTDAEVEQLVALNFELGEICSTHLTEHAEAVDRLGHVLRWRPNHEGALAAIEPYLGEAEYRQFVATTLEPVYEVHGAWHQLVGALEARLEFASGDEAVALLERISEVHLSELGDVPAGFDALGRLLALAPSHAEGRAELARVADALDAWDEYVVLLEGIATAIDDEELLIDYHFEVADVYADRLDDAANAQKNYEAVLQTREGDARALSELENLLTRTEQWAPLRDVLDRRLALASDPYEAQDLKFRIALLYEEVLEDPRAAIETYREILADDPQSLASVESLDRLYAGEQMWSELADNLRIEHELVAEHAKHDARNRLALVLEQRLQEPTEAVDLYESVVLEDDDNETAISALERMMYSPAAPRGRISRILEPVYAQHDQFDKMIAALEVQVDAVDDTQEKVDLLHRIAVIQENRANNLHTAFRTYSRALHHDVANESTLQHLYRIAQLQGEYTDLVAVFEAEAAAQEDPAVKRDLLRRAAQIYRDVLMDAERAQARLHDVLAVFPDDLETIEELEAVYRATQDWGHLVQVLSGKSELVDDVDEKKHLLHQAGTAYEEFLEQPDEAMSVYERILELDGADAPAIGRLEALYANHDRWDDLLGIYDRKIGLSDSDQERKELFFGIGAIHREALAQPDDAITAFRKVLDIDPRERAALQQLDELYQQTEQSTELLAVLDAELELATEEAEALTLKYRIGRLYETQLLDTPQAIANYSVVLANDPEHELTIQALESLIEAGNHDADAAAVLVPIYRTSQKWSQLIHIHRLRIAVLDDPELQLELFTEIGTTYEHRLDDPASAFEAYAQALEVEPARVETLNTLERLASMLNGWEVLVEILDGQLESVTDYDDVRTLNVRLARVEEEELAQPDAAIARFNRVLELDPDDQEAVLALDRLYQRQGYWEQLAEILRTRIIGAPEDDLLELRLRLGGVYQDALDDADQALETYQQILFEDPENPLAIERLEQMFMSGQAVTRVAAILEPYYSARQEHDKLVGIYLQRLQMLEDPDDIFDVYMLVAHTFLNEVGDKEGALSAYGKALEQKPHEQHVVQQIMDLAQETGMWGAAAESFVDALESPQLTDEAAVHLHLALATVFDTHLDFVEEAEQSYLNALRYDAGEQTALEALDRIYEGQGRWAELADVLRRRLDGVYDEELIVDLQYRRAQLFQSQLGELDEAVQTYAAILDVVPTHMPSLQMLSTIHAQLGQWQPLYGVLERTAEVQDDPDDRADTYAHLAQIAEEALEQTDDAIEKWNQVLSLQPANIDALRELRRLYLAEERWSDLVGVLEREVELTDDPDMQATLWESLGTIWADRLGNEGQALDSWNRVLEIDPTYLPALEAARELHTRATDYEALADVLYRMLSHDEVDGDRKLALWREQGELQGDMLMQPERAIEAWRQVLAYDPTNATALDNLERVFMQEARWEEAAHILEMKLDTIDHADERVELSLQIADIWESKIMDRDRAGDFYERILEDEPTNEQAGAQLESIYREQASAESFQKLANLYLDRSQHHATDPEQFLQARRQSAAVFEDQLQYSEGAFLVLNTAFTAQTYEDEQLLYDLDRLARETGSWDQLVGQVENVLREIGDVPEASDIHKMVGRWQAGEMGLPEEAVYHLQRALAIEPDNVEVMVELESLYREVAAWDDLAKIMRHRVELSADPDEQMEIWRRLGELYELYELYEQQTSGTELAVESYRHILELDPSDILAIESLERIFEANERWRELIGVLNQKAEATYDPDDMVAIRYRVALIWEEHLDEVDRAVETYREILATEQTHVASLQELERIFMSHQRWPELLDVYELQLTLTHDPLDQVQIYGRQAALHEESFDDVESAIEAYNHILMVDPENLAAIENLERLFEGHDRWFDLVDVLQRHADVTVDRDPGAATHVLNRLARVQRDQVNDPNAAIEAFTRSLHLDNEQADVWSELATLFEETANWSSAIEAYHALIGLIADVNYQVDVYARIGFLYDANLQNDQSAEEAYLAALSLDANHEASLLALRDLYGRRDDWQGVIRVLKQAEEGSRDLTQKAQYLCEIGKVYEHQIDDAVSALHYYESALENDPTVSEAATPLIDLYVSEQRWERAAPLLDRIISSGLHGSDEEQHRRYFQHARVSTELGREQEALASYRQAYELDPTHTDTLRGLSDLLYQRQEWEQAFKIFQALQFNHADALSNDEIVSTYYRAGQVKANVGERHKALQMYSKALEYDPTFTPALNALIDTFEQDGNWQEVVNHLQYLLQSAADDRERFAIHVRIGDVWVGQLGDQNNAVAAYLDALDIDPDSVVILRKLLDLYTRSKQWSESIEILKRIIDQEPDTSKKAKYFYTIAVICRDELSDYNEAVRYFNEALDQDMRMLKAFEAIDRIHTEQKEWKDLERAYRGMLKRVSTVEDEDLLRIKILLWQNLGEIYRSRLGHVKSAVQSYTTAVALNPGDEKLRVILADLHDRSSNIDGAIEQHKELVKIDPFRIESYRALWKAYMQKKQYDRAWCMSAALSFLQNANEQEEKWYQQYLGKNLKLGKGAMNPEMWKAIYHPDEEALIGAILGRLGQGLRPAYAGNLKTWGVHKKRNHLSIDEPLMFCKVYKYASNIMAMHPPELYHKSDQMLGMRNANVDPPAFIIGGDMMQGKSDRELAFTIAKNLCWARPEHYIGSIGQSTEYIKLVFMVTMELTNTSLRLNLGQNGELVRAQLMKMPPQLLTEAQKFMKQYLALGKNPNLSAWLTAVDHTTSRVGLLMCGDLHQAASCIKNDTSPVGKATAKEKIRELVLFAISDEYFELRERLGLAIGS